MTDKKQKVILETEEKLEDGQERNSFANQVMNNPEALALMQHKLAGMVGTLSGYYDSLPLPIKRRVKALKKLQVDALKSEANFHEEVHALECKYAKSYELLYNKRSDIINAKVEPTDEECDFPSDSEDEEDEKNDEKKDEKKDNEKSGESENKVVDKKEVDSHFDENTKGIPEFWLTIFKNVDVIAENIQEHDEPILTNLTDVKVKLHEKPMGFTLEFHFSPNDYFTNEVLTKYYELSCAPDEKDPLAFEGPEISKCKGCEISWKKGKNVTVKTIIKKQKHKSKGSVRTVPKTVPADSFFNFFSPPEVPENDDDEDDDETQALIAADFEIGEIIHQRLIPRAVLYFTGEALVDDEYEDDDEDESGSEESEEEEEDKDFTPEGDHKGKRKVTKSSSGGNSKDPQECQQQ